MSKILCLDDGNILTKEHIVRINETNKIEIVEVQRCKSGNNTKHWKVRFTHRGNTYEKELDKFLSIVSSKALYISNISMLDKCYIDDNNKQEPQYDITAKNFITQVHKCLQKHDCDMSKFFANKYNPNHYFRLVDVEKNVKNFNGHSFTDKIYLTGLRLGEGELHIIHTAVPNDDSCIRKITDINGHIESLINSMELYTYDSSKLSKLHCTSKELEKAVIDFMSAT